MRSQIKIVPTNEEPDQNRPMRSQIKIVPTNEEPDQNRPMRGQMETPWSTPLAMLDLPIWRMKVVSCQSISYRLLHNE